jgi:hypothetical protein
MDDNRFDNLARSIAGASRRRVLGGLLGGALGGALFVLGGDEGAARAECFKRDKRCRRDDQCCSGRCDHGFCDPCRRDTVICKGKCVKRDLFERDPQNCGRCGRRCDGDERCENGKCVASGGGATCLRDCESCSPKGGPPCCNGICNGICLPSQCRETGERCRDDCQCCFGICDSKSGRCGGQKP